MGTAPTRRPSVQPSGRLTLPPPTPDGDTVWSLGGCWDAEPRGGGFPVAQLHPGTGDTIPPGLVTPGQMPRQRGQGQGIDLPDGPNAEAELSRDCIFSPTGPCASDGHPRGLGAAGGWPWRPLPPLPLPSPLPPTPAEPHRPLSAPSHVKGLHLNMAFVLRNFHTLTLFLGPRFRKLFGYTERDMELMYPLKEKMFYSLIRESGYMHIQCTKPDTVGACPRGSAGVGAGGGGLHPFHPGGLPTRGPPAPPGALLTGDSLLEELGGLLTLKQQFSIAASEVMGRHPTPEHSR